MMEFLTRRHPTGLSEENNGLPITLAQLVQKALAEERLLQVMDPNLASIVFKKQEVVEELFRLALSCTWPDPEDRPDMDEVLSSLSKFSSMAAQNGITTEGSTKWKQNNNAEN